MRVSFAVMFLSALAGILVLNSPARAEVEVGKPAPALVVQKFNGESFDLAAEKGKVVVVNFWATWCGPCREEIPELSAFNRYYKEQGVDVIGVSVDSARKRDDAAEVAKDYKLPAALLDEAKTNGFDMPSYIPVTYVIDKQGIVRAKLVPNEQVVTEPVLADIVKPLLEKQTEAKSEIKSEAKQP